MNTESRKITLLEVFPFALGLSGLISFGPLIQQFGTNGVLILLALILTYMMAMPAWKVLVLRFPGKGGGIAPLAALVFRRYSPVVGAIIGVGYAMGWMLSMPFIADGLVAAFTSAFGLQGSTLWLYVMIFALLPTLALLELKTLARLLLPVGIIALLLAVLSILVPIYSGQFHLENFWKFYGHYTLTPTIPGPFGHFTALMASIYSLTWTSLSIEGGMCLVKHFKNPSKMLFPLAWMLALILILYYLFMPIVWQVALVSTSYDPTQVAVLDPVKLAPLFFPLFGGASVFVSYIMFISPALLTFLSCLIVASKVLEQLSLDGFIPKAFARTNRYQAPWFAILFLSLCGVGFIFFDISNWFVVVSNFSYVTCDTLTLIAAFMVYKKGYFTEFNLDYAYNPRPWKVYLGFLPLVLLVLGVCFGLQQFGLSAVVTGILVTFSMGIFYLLRRFEETRSINQFFRWSIDLKLAVVMFVIIFIDIAGYYLAIERVNELNGGKPEALIVILENLFIWVALSTLTVGLFVPGIISSAANQISVASRALVDTTMEQLSKAMRALGEKDFRDYPIESNLKPVEVLTKDEIGEMAENFNLLQEKVKKIIVDFYKTKHQLYIATENLEASVKARTKDLEQVNQELKSTQAYLVSTERINFLGQLAANLAHEINTPSGAIKGSIEEAAKYFQNLLAVWFDNILKLSDESRKNLYNFMPYLVNSQAVQLSTREERALAKEIEAFLEPGILDRSADLLPLILQTGLKGQTILDSGLIALAKAEDGLIALDLLGQLGRIKTAMDNIYRANSRIIEQVKALSAYSRKDSQSAQFTKIKEDIDSCLILLRNILKRGVDVEVKVDEQFPEVLCFPQQLNQVWTNIINNAVHAMKGEGKIEIRLKKINDQQVCVDIQDNGSGIPEEVQKRIFEPYFTTKPKGEGTGLGLSICKQIIENHEGHIEVFSKPGNTTFSIFLSVKPKSLLSSNSKQEVT